MLGCAASLHYEKDQFLRIVNSSKFRDFSQTNLNTGLQVSSEISQNLFKDKHFLLRYNDV